VEKDVLRVEEGSTASVFEPWYQGCGAMYMNRSPVQLSIRQARLGIRVFD